MNIEQLDPVIVWRHFARLCEIPHPSGHEEGIRRYILDFASEHHLAALTDAAGNVMIRKPLTAGNDDVPITIMQCHLDMVPQKNMALEFDFLHQPIDAYVDGDWIRARGTTLGADNGIGVAVALAVLEDNTLDHGPLHALFTIEEETGLTGATNVDPAFLKGHYLINLDSEEEGIACIGCAGGARTDFIFNADWEECPEGCLGIKIMITGLLGGHSGMDIHRERGNAVKIMANLLAQAHYEFGIRVAAFNGGGLDNAIPREAVAWIALAEDREMELAEWLDGFNHGEAHLLRESDPGIKIELARSETPLRVLEEDLQGQLLKALTECANGPQAFSHGFPDLVETSSNLASVTMDNQTIKVTTSQRSSIDRCRDELIRDLERFFAAYDAYCIRRSSYPGWPPEQISRLNEIASLVFEDVFLRELELAAIHAGLECGIFKGKNPELQMISIGPDIIAAHSPDERVRIASVKNFHRFLIRLLSAISAG